MERNIKAFSQTLTSSKPQPPPKNKSKRRPTEKGEGIPYSKATPKVTKCNVHYFWSKDVVATIWSGKQTNCRDWIGNLESRSIHDDTDRHGLTAKTRNKMKEKKSCWGIKRNPCPPYPYSQRCQQNLVECKFHPVEPLQQPSSHSIRLLWSFKLQTKHPTIARIEPNCLLRLLQVWTKIMRVVLCGWSRPSDQSF